MVFGIIITVKCGPIDQGLIENILYSDRGETLLMQKLDETLTDILFRLNHAKVFFRCHLNSLLSVHSLLLHHHIIIIF